MKKRIFRARYSSIRIKSPTRSPAFRIPCHRRNSSRSKQARWASLPTKPWWFMMAPACFSAPRVWWMFRVMGVKNVYVLDGGFDGWKKAGYPVTDEVTKIAATFFKPSFNKDAVVDFQEMRKIVDEKRSQIADARGAGRFTGATRNSRGNALGPYAGCAQCSCYNPFPKTVN